MNDIFISYKNDNSGNIFAEKLARDLRESGYSVYFNPHEQKSGPFDARLRDAIGSCKDFIAVVTKGYLEALLAPVTDGTNWIREEVLEARRRERVRITPVYLEGVSIPDISSMADDLPLAFFPSLDGVVMPGDNYDMSPLAKLQNRLLSRSEDTDQYRDVANGNPEFQASGVMRKCFELAGNGDYIAMYQLGLMFYYGFYPLPEGGAARDFGEAYKWLKRVSDGCADACLKNKADVLLARMYYQGEGTPEGQDYRKSYEYHMRSADDVYSAAQAAFMKRMGLGCEYDFEGIERFYRSIIHRGDVIAQLELADFYESHGRFVDAMETYLSMDPIPAKAHYKLGLFYSRGNHAEPPQPDYLKASYHFSLAMEKGFTVAAVELGHLYFRPVEGFPKDFRKARECYAMAAESGDATAQYMMGYMSEYGHVERDIEQAIYYFKKSASQGNILSSMHLAMLYQLPEHCNYSLAFKHCRNAAESGESQAEFMLGNLYLLGRGCAYDTAKARRWYRSAYDHGFTGAESMLQLLDDHREANESALPSWFQ